MGKNEIGYIANRVADVAADHPFTRDNAKKARDFHRTFPEYEMTPLLDLAHLAKFLGIASVRVKDESRRFGLNAFKVLGGSYSAGCFIAGRLGMDISALSYETLVSEEIHEKIADLTFVTATDGNHGRGIAWTADRLGLKSVVYMPKGSAKERLLNIRAAGAEAEITDYNYDDTVRYAADQAKRYGWILMQDTSWAGYRDVPRWIMEGYTTMADEIAEQMGDEIPTHVFLQAGVGSMAGAVAGYLSDLYREDIPKIIIVEPDKADCFFRTAKAGDGRLHKVTGPMDSMMAGLCCGEPCDIAWDILSDYASGFCSVPDEVAAAGMRVLGNPLPGDPALISGESGAAGFGLLVSLLRSSRYADLAKEIGLDRNARVLCISTEGDTDRENYRKVVWGI